MASLMDRLRQYQIDDGLDFNSLPDDLSRLGAGVDLSKVGKYRPAPFDDPLTHISGISSDLGNAASAIYDDPSHLYKGPLRAGGRAAQMMAGSASDAFTAPYRAYTEGLEDPESEALNMAGWLMGGGFGRAVGSKATAELGSAGGKLANVANDLPMDFESRMERARAMGFDADTPVYHGTNADFTAFDPSARGKMTGAKAAEQAIFSTPDSDLASVFADMAGEQGGFPNVMKMLVRPGKAGHLALDGSEKMHEIAATLAHVYDNGLDTVALDNYLYPNSDRMARVVAAKNPNQYRSVNAAFDPAKIDSDDLLAIGSPLLPLMPREKKERR